MILWDMKEEDLKGNALQCIHTGKEHIIHTLAPVGVTCLAFFSSDTG